MKDTKDYKFKFSIVSAVYNVEPYLDEMINSIIKQDIGFKENVQLILVDDGSTDNSGKICDKWTQKYPNNIITIHKQNGGVSSARNEGLKYVEGKYYNFCDSDDKFSKNVLSSVWKFFEKHEDEIDICTIPVFFFEAISGPLAYNNKFELGSRIIDLTKEYSFMQMQCNCSFFHNRIKDLLQFNTALSIAEDALYVQTLLLYKQKLGVVDNCKYWYRKRKDQSSAIQTAGQNENWYLGVIDNFYLPLFKKAKDMFGEIPPFTQYAIFSDLRWKLNQPLQNNIYKDDIEKLNIYKQKIYECYKYGSVKIINTISNRLDRLYIFKNIMGKQIDSIIRKDGKDIWYVCEKQNVLFLSKDIIS